MEAYRCQYPVTAKSDISRIITETLTVNKVRKQTKAKTLPASAVSNSNSNIIVFDWKKNIEYLDLDIIQIIDEWCKYATTKICEMKTVYQHDEKVKADQ